MNLTKWLEGLAGSYPHFKITKLQVFEYKQELESWSMTDDQWVELKSTTRRRHAFFPTIAELEEIMYEVKRQAAPSNGKLVWETWQGQDGRWYAKRPSRTELT